MCCLSPAHIGGMLVLLRHVVSGAPVTVLEGVGLDPVDPLHGVPAGAHIALVPTILRRLVAAGVDLSRFGIMLVGGAEIDAGLAEQVARLGGRAVSTYGLTETCGGIAYDGRLFDGTHARIGAAGSVELHGPTLMDGYRHDPAATADGVHARRLAPHRRRGRAARWTAGFGSTADRMRRSARARRPCGPRRSRKRSVATRR